MFSVPEFVPPIWLRGGTAQTIWSNFAGRSSRVAAVHDDATEHLLNTADGDRLRVFWNPAPDRNAPIMVVLHGLTGCARSNHVLGIADKALRRGFTVVRADLRNAQGETPSVGVGHAGRSEDVTAILDHVMSRSPETSIVLVGYSLGGNILLKALGESGDRIAPEITAAVAISVPIDLDAACTAIDSPGNRVFRDYFVRRLVRLVQARAEREPGGSYAALDLTDVRAIREFDGRVVAPIAGFESAEDYYRRCSSSPLIPDIRCPTLLIQSADDPFIPFEPFQAPALAANRYVQLLATDHGGHAGFWSRLNESEDRFWAEQRAVEFCAAIASGQWDVSEANTGS